MKKAVAKPVSVLFLSIIALAVLAFAGLMAVSGIFEKPAYLEPWKKDYAQKFDDPRVRLSAQGLLAANNHNMQPWKIRLDKDDPMVFYLYADSDRMTTEVDPDARQMMVTQGAFLECVRVAGNESGYQADIQLFPQGGYAEEKLAASMKSTPVAKITLTKAAPQNDPLYTYLFLPDTNRAPYRPDRLTAEQSAQLTAVNGNSGLSLKIYQDPKDTAKLKDHIMRGVTVEAGVNRVMRESADIFRPNEYQKNKYRYGFSVEGQGTSGVMRHLMQGLVTLFPSMNAGEAASKLFIQSSQASVNNTPAYAMIISKDNSRKSQVESGMLYSRLVLSAHRTGLVMQPLSQPLEEYSEMKGPYTAIHRDYSPGGGTIQMLVRLGQPTKEVPQSMRRDVMDLIEQG